MNGNHLEKMDKSLKESITNLVCDNDEKFAAIMHAISLHSCSILGMKYVAYKKQFEGPLYDERNEYFDGIESILKIIYSDCVLKLPLTEIFEMCKNIPNRYQNRERVDLIGKIKSIVPHLRISWVEEYKSKETNNENNQSGETNNDLNS